MSSDAFTGEEAAVAKGLTREKLVGAALAIVDREGLEALSMRKLGAELGVDPMAAYRHLPNKEALLDGVLEAVVSQVDLTVDSDAPWPEQLRRIVEADLEVLLAHPNALPLVARRPLTTPNSMRLVEAALAITSSAGIPRHEAILAINTMGLLVTGLAIAITAASSDAPSSEEMRERFAALPREEFPEIVGAIESGETIQSFEQILEFWFGALIARLEAVRVSAAG